MKSTESKKNFNLGRLVLILACAFAVLVTPGCRKRPLEGQGDVLIGSWECVSIDQLKYETGAPSFDTTQVFNASTIDLEIRFIDRGRVCIYRDGSKLKSSRIERWSSNHDDDYGDYFLRCPRLKDFLDHEDLLSMHLETTQKFTTASLMIIDENGLSPNEHYLYTFEKR